MKITVNEIESENDENVDEDGNKHIIHHEEVKKEEEEVSANIG